MIYSPSRHPSLRVYDFLISETNRIGVILKTVLAFPSFIMAVNGGQDFKAQKSASIHHKKVLHMASGA